MSLRGLVGGHEIVHSNCVLAAAEMYGCVANINGGLLGNVARAFRQRGRIASACCGLTFSHIGYPSTVEELTYVQVFTNEKFQSFFT